MMCAYPVRGRYYPLLCGADRRCNQKRGATQGTCPILAGTSSIWGPVFRSPRFKTLATHFETAPEGYA
jgi:hypothetical protein